MTIGSVILGATIGLAITVAGALLWPKGKLNWARPLVPPIAGVLVAYLLMRFA